jgi:DNA-binding response OmpR family regulator
VRGVIVCHVRIMVVDDEVSVREACVESLEAAGYRAEGFGRGEPALEAIADERPDVLVVNWRLPGFLDGVEIARRARRLQPDLRILMITGDAGNVAGRALGAGVLQVLQKPVTRDALLTVVQSLFDTPPGPRTP